MTADAIPAATLVLFRERAGAAPELLFVERAAGMAFAAGALVFPGGRIDPGDHTLAGDPALVRRVDAIDDEDAAARVAAIRETIEESGIAAGFVRTPEAATIALLRGALAAGEPLADLLRFHELILDLDALVLFARWRPNFRETRIFDTRFYIARVPAGAAEPVADATETIHVFWASAADVLDACARGEGHVIFPTRRNLERLAQFTSFEQARGDIAAHPVETITPWIEERDGEKMLRIPEGRGYPVTAEALASARRG